MTQQQGYDWVQAAQGKSGGDAPRIPPGEHQVKVTKVVFANGDGVQFQSKAGDPQILIVLQDAQGREATDFLTLSDKAGWKLARLLGAAGANLARMNQAGVTPQRFADEAFATKNLVGRQLLVQVAYEEGSNYATVTPLMPRQQQQAQGRQDEIPY